MRINEYNSLNEFITEYTGVWNPSEGHWFGLDFKYKNEIYRLHTGSMYNKSNTVLPDGRTALYGVYRLEVQHSDNVHPYRLLGEFADMNDLLELCIIENRKFKDIIIDDTTEILGKD